LSSRYNTVFTPSYGLRGFIFLGVAEWKYESGDRLEVTEVHELILITTIK
jgi:uncharacterized membrane protein